MTTKRNNQRRSFSSFRRKIGMRAVRQRFLIVCEGEKTEPNYFRSFHVSSAVLLDIKGIGANTDSLVKRAIAEKTALSNSIEAFDQVWCVFDRDSFPAQNFNNAYSLAKKNGINIAFSNEAFELWYLLLYIPPDPAGHSDFIRLDKVGAKRRNDKINRCRMNGYFFLKESPSIGIL